MLLNVYHYKDLVVNQDGNTTLMIAIKNNMSNELLHKIIDTGNSDLSHINNSGETALILACQYKFHEIALRLIDSGSCIPEYTNIYRY
jgi:ankyrin repeat protein